MNNTASNAGGSKEMSISEAFEAYRSNIIVFRGQSHKTEENHIYAMRSLLSYLGEDILMSQLTFEKIRDWKICLEKKHLASDTIRGRLVKLRVVLAYIRQVGVVCLDPSLIALPRRAQTPVDFLTKEEVARLIEVAGVKVGGYARINLLRNQAIISMLYGSGIRISEMCRLDRDSIYSRTFTAFGKGGKSRVAFIDSRTDKFLKAYLSLRKDSNAALFLANSSQARCTPGCVQDMLRRMGKKAAFTKPIHPHIFRHSFATNLLFNNTNPRFVQTLLGHSSLETTMHYMNVVNEDLKAIYEAKHTV